MCTGAPSVELPEADGPLANYFKIEMAGTTVKYDVTWLRSQRRQRPLLAPADLIALIIN
jgi:hypothetical protein